MKKLVVILIIIVLIFLTVNLIFLFSNTENKLNISSESIPSNEGQYNYSAISKSIEDSTKEHEDESDGGITGSISNQSQQAEECIAKNNLTKSTIVFFYMDELHSNNMKPIINALSANYTFYWQNDLFNQTFNSCLGYSGGTIPTFICAGTKQQIIGETSRQNLEAFARLCLR